jgi:hypothetical protein
MARPRIFISSSYYDLRHIRASLETFIQSLGYEPVLSEKGDIAYAPDRPLDDSCYREAATADMLVLIIGGRYGTEKGESRTEAPRSFYERYDSITKMEFQNAVANNVPVWILVDSQVYAEYYTFQRNKSSEGITYAHVDSVNIFHLIEDILSLRVNNPLFAFSRYTEMEDWLREQWAGVFRDLLMRSAQSQQLASLSAQVSELSEINKTLKTYLESLMRAETRDQLETVIETESSRLDEVERRKRLEQTFIFKYISHEVQSDTITLRLINEPDNFEQFLELAKKSSKTLFSLEELYPAPLKNELNEARGILGRPLFV